MLTFKLDIVSQTKKIYHGLIESMQVDTVGGQIGVRYGHAPLLTKLKPGMIKIVTADAKKTQFFYISGGVLEIQPLITTILADEANFAEKLDKNAILKARQDALKLGADQAKHKQSLLLEIEAKLKILKLMRLGSHK